MVKWPKEQLLRHGPELPIEERIRRYQHNIQVIRASGCLVPTPAMVDSLDPVEIELWFADGAFRKEALTSAISALTRLAGEGAEGGDTI